MKKKNNNIFKKGKWCPLFGYLPCLEDLEKEVLSRTDGRLIEVVDAARAYWGIRTEFYRKPCPLCPDESEIIRMYIISPEEIRSARLFYASYAEGCIPCNLSLFDPDFPYFSEEMQILEDRAAMVPGIESEISGVRLLALFAICLAAGALYNILNCGRDPLYIAALLHDAQAFLVKAEQLNHIYTKSSFNSEKWENTVKKIRQKENSQRGAHETNKKKKAKSLPLDEYIKNYVFDKFKKPRARNLTIRGIAESLENKINNDPDFKKKVQNRKKKGPSYSTLRTKVTNSYLDFYIKKRIDILLTKNQPVNETATASKLEAEMSNDSDFKLSKIPSQKEILKRLSNLLK